MAITEESVIEIVQSFANAVMDPTKWRDALSVTSEALECVTCTMEFADLRTGDAIMESPFPFEESTLKLYQERIFAISPRARMVLQSPTGVLLDDRTLLPEEDPNTPEFLDWLSLTPARYIEGTKILHDKSKIILYGAQYSEGKGPPNADQSKLNRLLSSILVDFIRASQALNDNRLFNSLLTLNDLEGCRPFALAGKGGFIMELSSGFESLMNSCGLLGFRHHRIVGVYPQHIQLVERFFDQATSEHRYLRPPLPLRLTGPSNPKGVVLRAVPMTPTGDAFDAFRPLSVITVIDLDQPNSAKRLELMAIFSLTEREADIASMIGDGFTIEKISVHLKISGYTIKQHLKSIFSKMEISRQSDLVAIIAKLF